MGNHATWENEAKSGGRHQGLTLLELLIAMTILALALLMLLSVIYSSGSLQQTTREKAAAYNFVRKILEEMRSATFSSVYSTYKAGGTQNAAITAGLNTPTSPYFLGLNRPKGAGVKQLDIIFPEVGGVLSEFAVDADLQMPKDLDQSGFVDNANVSTTYKILPVKVIVRWESVRKLNTQIQVCTFLTTNR